MRLTDKEIKKMLDVFSPKKLISMYTQGKIGLYTRQKEILIEMKNGKKEKYE